MFPVEDPHPTVHQMPILCEATFIYDFALGLSSTPAELLRPELLESFPSRSLSAVAGEYDISYTALGRWFYEYALDELIEEEATGVSVDEFAARKG